MCVERVRIIRLSIEVLLIIDRMCIIRLIGCVLTGCLLIGYVC